MPSSHPGTRARLPRGTVLDDRFEIREWLGSGSFGDVYRASQLVFGHGLRQVAVKLFPAGDIPPDRWHDLFSDAVILIGLQEENPSPEVARHLIRVYDIGLLKTPAPRAFVSMQLISGGRTLHSELQRWRRSGMLVAMALKLLRQILIPLAWMHSLEVPAVHGDLKPDNVLMTEAGDLVLTDFGLAGRLPMGTTGGALAYQAPEQLLRLLVRDGDSFTGVQADVYAAGLVFYELLTGRHPFEAVVREAEGSAEDSAYLESQSEARKWALRGARHSQDTDRIPLPSELNPEVGEHPQLEAILSRCLAYRPSERYANARVLLDDVERYIHHGSVAGISQTVELRPAAEPPAMGERSGASLLEDALLLLGQGRYAAAVSRAEEAVRRSPGDVPAMLVQARALSKAGDPARAQTVWAAARKRAPASPEVMETLAELYEDAGQRDVAQAMREQAASLRKSGPSGRRS